ncbi:23S rRNA (guanosine2251-2'-O)-methyltransferase [Orenia metallireducens]|jgi:23S rRNA (guanosine2251-2'-O)-methyltransferase|uniref:23S rRNA (Guanosine2251-2'-O)-methyltransferase n=1 Tax=Orenia metallireducens TaxID=1413210 RepID=A0A285H8C7_9FIRM|nr:23S rRNA (guanosine(2251)-2'-O)-methyltransferase RlmB [Orenia metallireducens]PRX26187.1 23S rRNA (guanosine2251-2'-O)-methyltransferase [Orenia metallireducens]SNY32012.1 23S rRNA (guanosine2251-2'-O)-methyltransferase [Orenia metallireducens]
MVNVEGRNPVIEALRAGRRIEKILVLHSAHGGPIDEIYKLAKKRNIKIEKVDNNQLDSMADSHAHQGVIAVAEELKYWDIDDLIEHAKKESDEPLLILLDELKDPHNFGSILRTADAAGAQGVVIPNRRSVSFTPVVAKSSAGAIEYVPVAQVTNLSRTIDKLKDAGFWIGGADIDAKQTCYQANLKGALGLVIGSEGSGMRRLVKEKCDFLIKLPMKGHVDSLNASVATGILIYETVRQREE